MSESKEPKVYEVNAQNFFIPMSIVIAGIIIAGAIFVTNGSKNDDLQGNAVDSLAGNELLEQALEEPQEAKVSVDDDAVLGKKEPGKIAIVEFSDYECPFCKSFRDTSYEQIKKEYIDSGEAFLVFRDLPLPIHDPVATEAAVAAECVREQAGDDAYYSFHDGFFDNTATNGRGVSDEKLTELAVQAGADAAIFSTCVDEQRFADEVQKDLEDANAAGITGTPGFVIGKYAEDGSVDGVIISGAQPFAVFQKAIEEAKNK